jgi:hypothetical protein
MARMIIAAVAAADAVYDDAILQLPHNPSEEATMPSKIKLITSIKI